MIGLQISWIKELLTEEQLSMEEKKKSSWVGFGVVCGLLMALGLFLRFAVVGYSFSSMICLRSLIVSV